MIEINLKSGRSLGWIFDTEQEMQKSVGTNGESGLYQERCY
ncbi:hypothetical protein ACT7DB_07855 [Bacillus cereus]